MRNIIDIHFKISKRNLSFFSLSLFFFVFEYRKYKCETCEKLFEDKMELKQHELDTHNIVPNVEDLKPYNCSYCDKRFTTRGKCNLHMETHSEVFKFNVFK